MYIDKSESASFLDAEGVLNEVSLITGKTKKTVKLKKVSEILKRVEGANLSHSSVSLTVVDEDSSKSYENYVYSLSSGEMVTKYKGGNFTDDYYFLDAGGPDAAFHLVEKRVADSYPEYGTYYRMVYNVKTGQRSEVIPGDYPIGYGTLKVRFDFMNQYGDLLHVLRRMNGGEGFVVYTLP